MKVDCPSCGGRLDADDLDISTGLGKCRYCGELIALRELLGEASGVGPSGPDRVSSRGGPPEPVDRPFDARVTVTESGGETIIASPAAGPSAGTVVPMVFAIPWLSFVAVWTAMASGILFDEGPPGVVGVIFPLFSIPFWLVGFGMFFGPLYAMTVSRRVTIGPHEVEFRTETPIGPRVRRFDRADVQTVRDQPLNLKPHADPTKALAGGIEFVHRGGRFVVPARDAFEKRWLLAEAWAALERTEPR